MSEFIPVCEPMLAGNELKYVTDAVASGWISSSGSYVERFENVFAQYCDSQYAVAVCNGTVAIHLALTALGIGKGDEVIIPSFTMIATAFAVCYTGAIPVFIDVEKDTWNIDVSKIERKITDKTKAIIPVHVFGNPCNMNEISRIAKENNLFIVEDAAEAHGAEYYGRKVGSFSDIASFSFFANKNITTGEGGMVVANSEEKYNKCKYYKNMCFPLKGPRVYLHDDIGFNYRMSNIHAAIGLAQMEKADDYREMRIRNAEMYKSFLSSIPGIIFQKEEEGALNVHWMNTIIIDSDIYGHTSKELMVHLKEKGIDTRSLFNSMSHQKALKAFGCDCSEEFPVTNWLSENGFYLPSASSLSVDKIKYICDVIEQFSNK